MGVLKIHIVEFNGKTYQVLANDIDEAYAAAYYRYYDKYVSPQEIIWFLGCKQCKVKLLAIFDED
jgi:hypothetical protein